MKTELAFPDVIRVETVLSRFPMHRLAKLGAVCIEIREADADGEMTLCWEVSCNEKYGQPGPLAYKIDTLVINRKLELAGRPLPKVIRLGSLREIAEATGTGEGNTAAVKRALLQNAGAFITARIKYRSTDGAERELDANFTRYEVHFAGERLPDGRKADAVYLVLGETYRRILDNALTRPLDYGYLRDLPPVAQRLYELASYRMFAALKNGSPTARLSYAEFCQHAPQARYGDFNQVKKQMHKVHAPHRKAGYLAGVEFEATTDREGRSDWMMAYMPGPKARAEYRAFTGKGGPVLLDVTPTPTRPKPQPEPTGLERELVARGVTPSIAADLVRDFPADRVRRQVEVVDWLRETKPKRIKDLGAYLVGAIREEYAAPAGFEGRVERAARETAKRAAIDREDEARQSTARARAVEARIQAYWEALPRERRAALEAEALAGAAPADRAAYEAAAAPVRRLLLVGLRDALIRRQLDLPAVD